LIRSTDVRKAAINASTVFAITLAIIAGLIFAWVFKTVFLTPKKAPVAAAEQTYRITVMALSVTDNQQIGPLQVKRRSATKAEYDQYKAQEKTLGTMLVGNQPIGRVTKESLKAEEPIYEGQLKDYRYPEPVSKKLEPGKVASIVEVPARNSMVQVDDRVDVLCTATNTNPELGPVETRTAVMAKNVRVVARFLSTRDAAQPPRSQMRPYTVEVTPYRYGLIELAKAVGGVFALRIHDRTGESLAGGSTTEEEEDPPGDRPVTTEDLVKVFGFEPQTAPKYFEVESFSGVTQIPGRHIFQQPGGGQAVKPSGGLTPGKAQPKAPGGLRPGNLPKGVTPGRVS
jgi:Flp pilus assembly protein CpaB